MSCFPRAKSIEKTSLVQLVEEFLEQDGCCPRDEVDGFRNLEIEAAIRKAARARDENGNFYPHQWNLREKYPDVPKKAELILVKCTAKIAACDDFDALHDLIKHELKGHVKGAGEMYCYDTAFRIGISMGIYPQKIYLHRGTRDGAKALGIYMKGRDVMKMSELVKKYPEFKKMKPHQIEDFLCIKKDILHKFKRI